MTLNPFFSLVQIRLEVLHTLQGYFILMDVLSPTLYGILCYSVWCGTGVHSGHAQGISSPQQGQYRLHPFSSFFICFRGVRSYINWSFIPDHKYTAKFKHYNPCTGTRSQPTGKISVALPLEDWLCLLVQ